MFSMYPIVKENVLQNKSWLIGLLTGHTTSCAHTVPTIHKNAVNSLSEGRILNTLILLWHRL